MRALVASSPLARLDDEELTVFEGMIERFLVDEQAARASEAGDPSEMHV